MNIVGVAGSRGSGSKLIVASALLIKYLKNYGTNAENFRIRVSQVRCNHKKPLPNEGKL
jgi:hypothetical protein